MNIADLGRELDVPPARLIDLCTRLGLDATWAGANLSHSEAALLRAKLAEEERYHGGVDDRPTSRLPATPSGLPPTAVGSLPAAVSDPPPDHSSPGFSFAGGDLARDADRSGPVVPARADGSPPRSRSFDRSLRPAVVSAVLAVAALVAAEVVDEPWAALAGWVAALVLFVVAGVAANRARYRISTHPERRRGLAVAIAVLVVSVVGLLGLGLATWTVVRSAPADQAPLGLGDLRSVQHLRWGFERLTLIADNGWSRPAKDVGTCWEADEPDAEPRVAERVEFGADRTSCESAHAYEVLAVYSVDRDADAPYPGEEALWADALERCATLDEPLVDDAPDDLQLRVEVPTRDGWERGDHDVACVSVLSRDEPLGG